MRESLNKSENHQTHTCIHLIKKNTHCSLSTTSTPITQRKKKTAYLSLSI